VAVSLAPVPAEEERASCPNCSAPLAADQRYCLACGQPVSPVRLAFLDVLQSEQQPSLYGQGAVPALGAGYQAMGEPASRAYAWLRRYSGVLALLSVLLMSIIVGLLVGHWITQSRAPAEQVVKVEGLSGTAPASAGAAASTTAPAASAPATTKASPAKAEAAEAKEAKALEKSAAPKVVKASPTKLQKLGNTTGKKHEEEVAKLGSEPVETGG
jgi:hypothetical protein